MLKQIIVVLIALVSISDFANAKAKSLDRNDMKGNYTIRTICVDGYKFVVANRIMNSTGQTAFGDRIYTDLQLTQFFENVNGVSVPAKCQM